ncbi:MAG: twin-arginine translocase TatA/TatE family subunit [Planctomycetes bacterium]|nr:twin-arginine translocase TatA/TatE family subunit [Planctomycetota bacterium]
MLTILAIGFPGVPEMMIVGLIVLLLFGSRLPSVMRSLGIGITEFKKGIRGEIDENGEVPGASIENQDEPNPEDSQTSGHSKSSTPSSSAPSSSTTA